MLPARKSRLADATIGRFIARSVRRNFHALYVLGAEHLAALDPARPVVGCANHTNWWDGFVLYAMARARLSTRQFFLAMEERNLRRYFFFPWLGAFGVGRENDHDAVAGVRYAVRLLSGHPDRMAWMFVQGALTPAHEAIVARPGAGFIARHASAALLPVVLRYEWLHESKATIFASIGAPLASSTTPEDLAGSMNALSAELRTRTADASREAFEAIYPPRLSLNKRWDYARHVASGGGGKFERENR